jgi:copper(I)-binding protein
MKLFTTLGALLVLGACADPGEPKIDVSNVVIVGSAGVSPTAIYATLRNDRAVDDSLLTILPDSAEGVMLHQTLIDASGRVQMEHLEGIGVPAKSTLQLKPGSYHAMVSRLSSSVVRGDSLNVTFRFLRAGAITVRGVVIDQADVDAATSAGDKQ